MVYQLFTVHWTAAKRVPQMDEASTTSIAEVGASGKMKERAHSD
jgi:hypothetical protein